MLYKLFITFVVYNNYLMQASNYMLVALKK